MIALALLAAAATAAPPASASPPPAVLIVVGAPGTPAYAAGFAEIAARWQKAAGRAGASAAIVGVDNERPSATAGAATPTDRARFETALRAHTSGVAPLWLILIGHGTHDGRQALFNLRGPDISAQDLATWCKPITRPLIVINGASASAPFITALSGPGRVVVTATRIGRETSAPRFGGFFAEAITDRRADLDRDGGVSLFEAFVHASGRVEASFAEQGLLASEHALLDDNGDGLGTGAAILRGRAPAADPEAARDGARARQLALVPAPAETALPVALRRRRDQLEEAVLALCDQRAKLSEATYFSRLQPLLLELARLYRRAGSLTADAPSGQP